jgi:UDP-2,3-diacylglucosamine hydrolase
MNESYREYNSAPLYFLSDVHLGVGSKEQEALKQKRLTALLDEIGEQKGTLFIVGDLFDFWYEYRHVVPAGHHRIITALENLVEKGIEVSYLAGNHDFAIGRSFSEMLGIQVVRDDLTFQHDGKRFYLYHGDGLALNDRGYRMLKAVLRNRFAQWAFRWIHPDVGIALAHRTSHGSREYTKGKDFGESDGMLAEARSKISNGMDYVIMGHRHIPAMHELDGGVYVNLGDWIRHYSYGVYTGGKLRLYTLQNNEPEELDIL